MGLLVKPYHPIVPLKGYKWSLEIHGSLEGHILADVNKDGNLVEIPTLRIFGRRLDKYSANRYWDVTTSQLSAMLEAFLRVGALVGKSVTFSTVGKGRTRRDTISIGPIS
jgi:hypothetical protein